MNYNVSIKIFKHPQDFPLNLNELFLFVQYWNNEQIVLAAKL
jgi:hypothetical protein